MKTARTIWDLYKDKKLTTKEAFDEIALSLIGASAGETTKLMALSDTILDGEVEFTPRNEEAEKTFYAITRKKVDGDS